MPAVPPTPEGPSGPTWHRLPVEAVLARLGADPAGLSSGEAAQRLAAHGPNALPEGRRIGPLAIALRQFQSLIVWVLIAAGVVSGALGEMLDAAAILAIVLLNAGIGFHQEYRAEKSIAALRKLTAPQAKVRRDRAVTVVPAAGIVPGDILHLEAGDLVAADARLLEAAALRCSEAALTGEAEAVPKQTDPLDAEDLPLGDRSNMVYMGTIVAGGTGRAVVVATARDTELGRIAGLMAEAGAEEATPLQRKLDAFGRVLIWAALGIVGLLFVMGLRRGTPLLELFLNAVSLAVAAVPEGLPAVVTVALALGVARMARRRALVRRLPAVETLGATTVICTDKTGTLTAGEMTVRALYVAGRRYTVTGEGYAPQGEVRVGGRRAGAEDARPLEALATVHLGCNDAHLVEEEGLWKVIGDPTEGALLAAGSKAGGDREALARRMPAVHEFPFDSERKRRTVVRRMSGGGLRALVNGAPDILLERCAWIYTPEGVRPLAEPDRRRIAAENDAMAQQALRVLGSAWRDLEDAPGGDWTAEAVERDLVFVGLSGMYDPPRAEAREAVARCRAAGTRVVMITGDHPHTALAVAREIGIAAEADRGVAGSALDRLTDAELRRRAPGIPVYARVSAAHKLRIVRAWKANGAVVAMTGDGVNDAPAVKGADIGIAMGRSGTEVTKQASDMVITDDNFASIVAAVEEGRGIYDNIRKTLQYLLAGNTGELLLMTACVFLGLPLPLLPIHLLWINLVTDGLPALCLATDPIDPDVMRRPPRPPEAPITDRGFLHSMALTGALTAGVTLAVFLQALQTGTLEEARSCAFAVLVFAELLRAFGARSETKTLWQIPPAGNLALLLVVAASFGLQLLSQHHAVLGRFLKTAPLPLAQGLLLLAAGAVPLAAIELLKVVRQVRRPRRGSPEAGAQR